MTEKTSKFASLAAAGTMLLATGCKELPGNREQQGAAIGGLSGAAVGAAVAGDDNRILGALIGGALGAGGGYLIGANTDKLSSNDSESAREASRRAQTAPVSAQEARNATSADVNNDGFVTMDEVVAMEKAGLSDREMIDRMHESGQVFELTAEQREHLREQGVSQNVLEELPRLNQDARERLTPTGSVLGRPQSDPDLNEPLND